VDKELLEKIRSAFGFKEFNELQKESIPLVIEGKNIIIVAPTGYGKTEAAMAGIFYRIIKEKGKCLYITPLRSLNRDMFRRLIKAGIQLGISVDVRHGDTPPSLRRKQALSPPDVLITTPETFQILFFGKRLRKILEQVKYVIIDEVHEMIGSKRGVQLSLGLERLREITKFQTILLSATVKRPREYAEYFMGEEEFEVINFSGTRAYRIKVFYPEITKKDEEIASILFVPKRVAWSIRKIYDLIINTPGSCLIFTNTRETAELISSRIKALFKGISIETHHSSLSRAVREEHEKMLREGELKGLVATSSMELGIDIGHIDAVIQFMSPRQVKRLVQRVGRSRHRMGEVSIGYIVTMNFDDYCESLAIKELGLQGYLEEEDIHANALDVLCHQIAGILIDKRRTNLDEIFRIIRRSKYYRKFKKEMLKSLLKFMDEIRIIRFFESDGNVKMRKRTLLYYIENISMIPDEKSYLVIDEEERKPIGILHEEFVANYGHVGNVIVIKGECWRIVGLHGTKIFVRREKEPGEIPAWEGELIPVNFDVAQKATEYRGRLITKFFKNPPWIPRKDEIVVEWDGKYTILNCPFGLKVNEVIGRILARRLGEELGMDVRIKVDPYRIVIKYDEYEDVIRLLKLGFDYDDLIEGIKRTSLFRIRMFHVARRFGIFSREASFDSSFVLSTLRELAGTPVEAEALREFIVDKTEIEKAKEIMEKIKTGKIKINVYRGVSDLTKECSFEVRDVYFTKEETLALVRERLERTKLYAYCINEKRFLWEREVREIYEFKCPHCGGILSYVRSLEADEEEIYLNADLVQTYRKPALYVIASFVPKEKRSDILGKYSTDLKELISKIADEERKEVMRIFRRV